MWTQNHKLIVYVNIMILFYSWYYSITVISSAPATTSAGDAMSILDTITTLNQEASVRASSSTEKVRKGQISDESTQLQLEEGVEEMNVVEEGDSSHCERKAEEGIQELSSEVKMEESQDQMDLERESYVEEVKMEEEKPGAQEPMEENKDKALGKTAGKPEEEHSDDVLKSFYQAKQKAKERIKEGRLLSFFKIYHDFINCWGVKSD